MIGKTGSLPSPTIPTRLIRFSDRRIWERTRVARSSCASGGEILIRVAQVSDHQNHGRIVLDEMINGGRGIAREA